MFIPGHSPYAMQRLTHADAERLCLNQLQGRLAITAVDPQAVPAHHGSGPRALPARAAAAAAGGTHARLNPARSDSAAED